MYYFDARDYTLLPGLYLVHVLRGAASLARRHAGGLGHEVRRYLVITPSGIGQKYADMT